MTSALSLGLSQQLNSAPTDERRHGSPRGAATDALGEARDRTTVAAPIITTADVAPMLAGPAGTSSLDWSCSERAPATRPGLATGRAPSPGTSAHLHGALQPLAIPAQLSILPGDPDVLALDAAERVAYGRLCAPDCTTPASPHDRDDCGARVVEVLSALRRAATVKVRDGLL